MIIGVNGFKGAGKDTIADHLVSKYGFEKTSFAALLKQSVCALFDISLDDIERWKSDPKAIVSIQADWYDSSDRNPDPAWVPETKISFTFRQFLQRFGTEAHRDIFGYNFWVDNLMQNLDWEKDYVISDARFENELKAITHKFGFNWNVERPGYEGEDHASEVAPDPDLIDYYIYNIGTVEFLRDQVDAALRKSRREAGEPSSNYSGSLWE